MQRLRVFTTASLLALAASLPTIASAQEYEADDSFTPTHTGFFLRGALGFGYSALSTDIDGTDLSMSGVASHWNFALGGSVSERIALHFSYWGSSAFNPSVQIDGKDVSDDDLDDSLAIHALGAGMTFYTPRNWYVGGQAGMAFATASDASAARSDSIGPGLALGAIVGKEWFVVNQLGLGVAGQLSYSHVSDDSDDVDVTWSGLYGGPMFSLTFN